MRLAQKKISKGRVIPAVHSSMQSVNVSPELLELVLAAVMAAPVARSGRRTLADIRTDLDGIKTAHVDAALVQLQRNGTIVLYRNDVTRTLTAADHAAALYVGDAPRHLVYVV